MSDLAAYHRRRAAQHRRMMAKSDPHYASIHRTMMAMHEERAASAEGASGDGTAQPTLPKR